MTTLRAARSGLRWAPDSSRVVYAADQEVDEKLELYTSLAAGGGNVKVSAPMTDDSDVRDQFYYWAPDSSRIAYQIQIYNPISFIISYEVRTATGAGGSQELISPALSSMIFWSSDSSRLVFSAQDVIQVNVGTFVPGPMELFASGPDGSEPVRLSGDMTATASHVVFIAAVR